MRPEEVPGPAADAVETDLDVLVVGAGLSGIAAGYHLQKSAPWARYAIVEAREAIGGTWDLFRYPGIRSDSDMHTLGFSFRPWRGDKAITSGESIADYVRETARAYGIDRKIRFGRRAVRASWSEAAARWTVEIASSATGKLERYTCRFLYMCTGYYDYARPHLPAWPGLDRFQGVVAVPQHWPQGLDYTGKQVVVIGSGATAVTVVPEMAKRAAHVTMLQRSPTYIVSRPAKDAVADWLNKRLPAGLAHTLVRWKNVLLGMYFYRLARKRPDRVKAHLLNLARQQLGEGFDMRHLTPRYNPWDQRICLVPDADMFTALRTGAASIVTDEIEGFEADGVRLKSGETLKADVVVPATGLNIQLMGGMELVVEGRKVDLGETLSYRGYMFSGVPNLALTLGYTNASWTLKCELIARSVCRILNHMRTGGYEVCTPDPLDVEAAEETALPLMSGYVQRAASVLPKQGRAAPWIINQNYLKDRIELGRDSLTHGALRFSRPAPAAVEPAALAAE